MKSRIVALFAAMVAFCHLFLLGGCTPQQEDLIWPHGSPESTELLHRFDTLVSAVDQKMLVRQLYSLARQHPEDDELQWRVLICDAETRDGEEALRLQNRALALMDTSEYKYDYMRLQVNRAIASYPVDLYRRYMALLPLLDYFISIGDVNRQNFIYISLGTIFDRLHQPERACEMFLQPYKRLEARGVSNSLCYVIRRLSRQIYALGDHQHAYEMLTSIADEEVLQSDTLLHVEVLRSLFDMSTSVAEKDSISRLALRLVSGFPDEPEYGITHKVRAKYYLLQDQLDSAYSYMKVNVSPEHIRLYDVPGRYDSYKLMASLLSQMGQLDSAYYYLEKSNQMNDSLVSTHRNIMSEDISRSIAENDRKLLQAEERKQREHTIVYFLMDFALLLAILFAGYSFYKWRKNRHEALLKIQENERLKREMDQRSEKYATANVILAGQKNLLDSINELVNKEAQDNGQNVTRQVKNIIRSYISDTTSRDALSLEFEHDYPGLIDLIRATYPSLTPTDLKICIYSFIKLDTHQISHLLNILPESVKKSRQRVRKKLGISGVDITIEQHISDLYTSQQKHRS